MGKDFLSTSDFEDWQKRIEKLEKKHKKLKEKSKKRKEKLKKCIADEEATRAKEVEEIWKALNNKVSADDFDQQLQDLRNLIN